MIRTLTGITSLLFASALLAQTDSLSVQNAPAADSLETFTVSDTASSGNMEMDTTSLTENNVPTNGHVNGNGFVETANRLPQLLRDVKVYLSDALIADVHSDTLEVIYNLDRIFELLGEADQLGEMIGEDREEFNRFENSLIDVYAHRLTTLETSDIAITAEQLHHQVGKLTEPLEIEVGNSKYTVIDDRDGHIPLVMNKKVEQYISFFTNKGRKQFEIWLQRYAEYGELIHEILSECELPEELVFLAMIESGLNPKAYSRASAVGLWQFIYSTGKNYGLKRTWYVDERRDPVKSTHAACAYLKDLYKEFDNWYLAMVAYNSGSGRVHRAVRLHQTNDFWQMHSLPRETRNYMPYYLATAIIGSDPEKYGFKTIKKSPLEYDEVILEKSADLTVLARAAGIKLKTLQKYNPELRQSATPDVPSYVLKLPKEKKEIFLANYNALPEDERFAPVFVTHRIRKGESLWTISKKYGISIHDLASRNKIRNRHKIRIGQKLVIPVRGSSYSGAATNTAGSNHKQVIHKVRKGDTLGHIAERYRTRSSKIRRWNGIKYGQYIHPGQKLIIWVKDKSQYTPPKTSPAELKKLVYKVRKGDTLSQIAERNGTFVGQIRKWNGLKKREYIYPGQKLTLWIKAG